MPGPYWCIRLTTRAWKTDYTACQPRKTTTYILHVVFKTTHTHDRRKSIGKKKQRQENKIKERKEKKRPEIEKQKRGGKKRKEKRRKARKDKTRRGSKERKKRKKCHTSRPKTALGS